MDAATVARRWMQEVWNEKRLETVDELLDEQAVGHLETGDLVGRGQFKVVRTALLQTFPDVRLVIDEVVSAGESAVVRFHGEATHAGGGIGLEATNRRIPLRGMAWFHVRDGRIVEGWDHWNMSTLSQTSQAVEEHLTARFRDEGLL